MQNLLIIKKIYKYSATFLLASAVALLTGCGDGGTVPVTGTGVTGTGVASLQLGATSMTVKSDNSSTSTLTVVAVDAGNAMLSNIAIAMSADTGNLSTGLAVTDSTGKATVTFSSGSTNKTNRIATITATTGGITTQIPIQIVGSTVTVTPPTGTLSDDGSNPVTLVITAKDAGGNTIPNTAVTLTKTGSANVTLAPASGTTDQSGQLSVTATGAAGGSGTATVSVAAAGATATSTLTVSASTATFSIDLQTLNGSVIANNTLTAMSIGDTLVVQVNAPLPTTNVLFATTMGKWDGGASSVVNKLVAAGKATATLTTTGAGIATIQVYDAATPNTSDSLTVTMTAAAASASSITIQASPSVVPKSTGNAINYSTLTASVKDAGGFPVGGAPVAFEIITPTGGGETVSPVMSLSAATNLGGLVLGDATTTFTSGSVATGATGVQVRASVVGTAIATEANLPTPVALTPSGNDAQIIIGGTAGSVAFGMATELRVNSNASQYIQAMSVIVTDSNGNPVQAGTPVDLSVWPLYWSTGTNCIADDTVGVNVYGAGNSATTGTFLNEDSNENVIKDAGEDGTRINTWGPSVGSSDNILTPPNSAAGSLPATVYTDANGVANFDLTYPKTSGIYIKDRIRARTTVLGTEAIGEMVFRLQILKSDGDPCIMPPSPYQY